MALRKMPHRHSSKTLKPCCTEAKREVCSSILAEAQALGYLDHADACRKGIDSETCTCGIIAWLPRAMCGTIRRSRAHDDE